MSTIDPANVETSPIAVQAPKPVPFSKHQNQTPTVIYTREQKGHSLTLHLLFGAPLLWIHTLYFAFSPRHYFHA